MWRTPVRHFFVLTELLVTKENPAQKPQKPGWLARLSSVELVRSVLFRSPIQPFQNQLQSWFSRLTTHRAEEFFPTLALKSTQKPCSGVTVPQPGSHHHCQVL